MVPLGNIKKPHIKSANRGIKQAAFAKRAEDAARRNSQRGGDPKGNAGGSGGGKKNDDKSGDKKA
jgi:hypothetical protein